MTTIGACLPPLIMQSGLPRQFEICSSATCMKVNSLGSILPTTLPRRYSSGKSGCGYILQLRSIQWKKRAQQHSQHTSYAIVATCTRSNTNIKLCNYYDVVRRLQVESTAMRSLTLLAYFDATCLPALLIPSTKLAGWWFLVLYKS